jgi:hypothetical protein
MNIVRRKLAAILVPLGLIVLVVGTSVPASAASDSKGTHGQDTTTTTVPSPGGPAKPLSLNW